MNKPNRRDKQSGFNHITENGTQHDTFPYPWESPEDYDDRVRRRITEAKKEWEEENGRKLIQ